MAVRHLDPPGDRRDAIIFARDLAAAEPILRLRLRMTPLVRLLRNGMTRRICYDRGSLSRFAGSGFANCYFAAICQLLIAGPPCRSLSLCVVPANPVF